MLQVRPPSFFVRKRITNTYFCACPLSDTPGARTLGVRTTPLGGASNNSVQSCTDACFASGYPLAGVEYSDECCTYHLSPRCLALFPSHYISKIVAPPLLTAALRLLRAIAPWSAAETAPRSVVAQAGSPCTITPAPTFRRLALRPRMVAAGEVGPRFCPSFPVWRLDGRTTLAGCRFSLDARDVETC